MKEGHEMPGSPQEAKSCKDFEALLVLYAWGELDAGERAAVETHARQCSVCATSLAREQDLQRVLTQNAQAARRPEPSELLLVQCRSELAEALDDAEERARHGWQYVFFPAGWLARMFAAHPAWGAALLVLLGVAVGVGLPQWYRGQFTSPSGPPAMTVSAAPRLSDQDLQTMSLAGISWVPDGSSSSPRVELRLNTEKPLILQGDPDDTDVKRVLTFVIENGQRFDPGARLDSVDVLRTRNNDGDVRQTLCAAARKDRNPAVRLKALEALHGFEQEDTVRQTMLEALLNDPNPGIRIEAINSLFTALRSETQKSSSFQDPRLLNVLRDRVQRDPNNYVRLQSAAAIRQLGPRQVY